MPKKQAAARPLRLEMVAQGSFENDLETVASGTQIAVAIARNWSEQIAG
jgi:hypothetical protein